MPAMQIASKLDPFSPSDHRHVTAFEVGSIFRIIDEASPTLRLILRQVRELNVALDKARASLTELSKGRQGRSRQDRRCLCSRKRICYRGRAVLPRNGRWLWQ
jgi:hypothetical protein